MKSDKRFMVEAHRRRAKHQRVSFIKLKVARHFWNMLYQILQINYVLFHFNRTNLSVCFLILYMNMLCFSFFNWKRRISKSQNF